LEAEVKREWEFWFPIVNGTISYTEACQIEKNYSELLKVNLAISKFNRDKAKSQKKRGK